jgi:hypothetical protein
MLRCIPQDLSRVFTLNGKELEGGFHVGYRPYGGFGYDLAKGVYIFTWRSGITSIQMIARK